MMPMTTMTMMMMTMTMTMRKRTAMTLTNIYIYIYISAHHLFSGMLEYIRHLNDTFGQNGFSFLKLTVIYTETFVPLHK